MSTSKHWEAPAGLDRSRPRRVRPSGAGFALIVASITLLVGSVVVTIGLQRVANEEREERRLMREEGANGQGIVSRLWRGSGESPPRWAAYTFSVDGRRYSGEARASRRVWERLKIGSTLPIRFLKDNPSVNVPIGWERSPMPGGLPAVVGFAMLVGGILCLLPIQRQTHLLSEGRAGPGLVTGHKKHGHATEVLYEFHILSGASVKGHSTAGKVVAPVGSPIWVLYDSEDPHRNTIYPLLLVKLSSA